MVKFSVYLNRRVFVMEPRVKASTAGRYNAVALALFVLCVAL